MVQLTLYGKVIVLVYWTLFKLFTNGWQFRVCFVVARVELRPL